MLWYIVHSVVYTCDLILTRIWLLGLCPFINRVLHAYSTLFPLGDTLLLLSSCQRKGVCSALPGLRGLLGVRLPVDVPVAPCSASDESYRLCFTLLHTLYQTFVIIVIDNICTRFIISFYVIYCSFCCIYVWLDPGTYMIARFMSFYKPGVTCLK